MSSKTEERLPEALKDSLKREAEAERARYMQEFFPALATAVLHRVRRWIDRPSGELAAVSRRQARK